MKQINKLAGQTAVYGLGTIIPRFLNYALLTPFYTRIFDTGEYGVVTELYAYMVLLLVMLTYGMETAYFRFSTKGDSPKYVYNTTMSSVLFTSLLFILFISFFNQQIANVLEYPDNREYIILFSIIIAIDAFTAIPFAKLRGEEKSLRFALIKIINVAVIILLALFFFVMAPKIIQGNPDHFINMIYSEKIGVGYVFIANLAGSLVTLLLLLPEITGVKIIIDKKLWKEMLKYGFPLLIAGLAGTVNDVVDKVVLKHLLPDQENAMNQLGIYGANYKIGVIMALFIQMFRYAFEPFAFANYKRRDAKKMYADVMKYFVLFGLFIFLGVTFYLEVIVKILLGKNFIVSEGMKIVPVILMGYLFYGIFVNLSVWYKLKEITKYGAIITVIGGLITVIINVSFVPVYGYHASAWAHIACYFVMVLLSYLLGRKYYEIPYEKMKISIYFIIAIGLFYLAKLLEVENEIIYLLIKTGLLGIFAAVIMWREKYIFAKNR